MKRLIAIGLIGLFSLVMVGTVYSSFNTKAPIELKKDFGDIKFVAVLNEVAPTLKSFEGKAVALETSNEKLSGYNPEVKPSANDPPTIRML